MWYQSILLAHKQLVNSVKYSVFREIVEHMVSYVHSKFCLTFKAHSETKFVAHLLQSFQSYFRNINGLRHLYGRDLSWTRKKGRANLWLNNLANSAELYIGESFITDTFNMHIIPLSKLAQSDLFPIYKFPNY